MTQRRNEGAGREDRTHYSVVIHLARQDCQQINHIEVTTLMSIVTRKNNEVEIDVSSHIYLSVNILSLKTIVIFEEHAFYECVFICACLVECLVVCVLF